MELSMFQISRYRTPFKMHIPLPFWVAGTPKVFIFDRIYKVFRHGVNHLAFSGKPNDF